jgi:UDP-2,3-diacylglucosamine pyrophosphatase LpxH
MKKRRFHITLIMGHTHRDTSILCDEFKYSPNGAYTFYSNNEIIACYPIQRTVISKIEEIEEIDEE